jgi:hypothetical protein
MTGMLEALDRRIDELGGGVSAALKEESHHALTLRLTLLLVVLHGATTPVASVAVRTLGLLMLVLPSLATRATLWWWMIAAVIVAVNADQWEMIDNHQYLITYWIVACCLTLSAPHLMPINARLLVAVAFAFAVVWKVIAGEYGNGGFFFVTFLTDGRLQKVAGAVSNEGLEGIRQAGRAITALSALGGDGSSLELVRDPRLVLGALGLSWAGLAVESAVAFFHLMPGLRWYRARHVSLMTFVAFTYLLLPVIGFGFVLGVLGFAQVRSDDLPLKRAYILLLCFLQLSLVPWRNLLVADV